MSLITLPALIRYNDNPAEIVVSAGLEIVYGIVCIGFDRDLS